MATIRVKRTIVWEYSYDSTTREDGNGEGSADACTEREENYTPEELETMLEEELVMEEAVVTFLTVEVEADLDKFETDVQNGVYPYGSN